MRKILTIMALMMSLNSLAQQAYDISKDEKNGSVVFRGPITFNDLQQEETFTWFDEHAAAYHPHQKEVDVLKDKLRNYRIIVFMGTWCSDSKLLVPQLYKLLTLTSFPMGECTIFGVDRTKTTKGGEQAPYNIEKVPTIILIRNGKEAGRITETVHRSLERDLVRIIAGDK